MNIARLVCSGLSLILFILQYPLIQQTENEDLDQCTRMCRMILAYDVLITDKGHFHREPHHSLVTLSMLGKYFLILSMK